MGIIIIITSTYLKNYKKNKIISNNFCYWKQKGK